MGKQLDGRSDVYALGVVAYEMITGRLPFPDAKGPAGLITAQLKQTPQPPSVAYPKTNLPPAGDKAILKCLEKAKENRFPDVTALANALQEVIAEAVASSSGVLKPSTIPAPSAPPPQQVPSAPRLPIGPVPGAAAARAAASAQSADMLETRRGELPQMVPPPLPAPVARPLPASQPRAAPPVQFQPASQAVGTPSPAPAQFQAPFSPQPSYPMAQAAAPATPYPLAQAPAAFIPTAPVKSSGGRQWVWWILALLVLGAGVGAAIAFVVK